MLHINHKSLSHRCELVAQLQGENVYMIILQNDAISVALTNLGCSILSVETPDKEGCYKNIVAGFSSLEEYLVNRDYLGCVIGRYANRIAGGKFNLDRKQYILSLNDGTNHLHGGVEGFHKKIWNVDGMISEAHRTGVTFSYVSIHGEEGYPGNLQVVVSYSLNNNNQLCIEMEAQTDQPTPVNLTNHTYFNLSGFENPLIDDHLLEVNASFYSEKDDRNLPTGFVLPVSGTALDFTMPRKIGNGLKNFPRDMGYDHNFVLEKKASGDIGFAARLYEPESGRMVTVSTSQPGLQVYTANYWDSSIIGIQGYRYRQHGGVALETQAFPDSPNQPSFPDTILRAGETYRSETIYAFGVC